MSNLTPNHKAFKFSQYITLEKIFYVKYAQWYLI